MYCPECGSFVDDNAAHCSECGAMLIVDGGDPPSDFNNNNAWGSSEDKEWTPETWDDGMGFDQGDNGLGKFNDISNENNAGKEFIAVKPKKPKTAVIIAIIAAVVIVLVVLAILIIPKFSKDDSHSAVPTPDPMVGITSDYNMDDYQTIVNANYNDLAVLIPADFVGADVSDGDAADPNVFVNAKSTDGNVKLKIGVADIDLDQCYSDFTGKNEQANLAGPSFKEEKVDNGIYTVRYALRKDKYTVWVELECSSDIKDTYMTAFANVCYSILK